MLLYDEILFLTRSLCPENLREAPFVRFLDESGLLPDELANIVVDHDGWSRNPELATRYTELRGRIDDYWAFVKRIGINWDAAPDNHTHGLNIGGKMLRANSFHPELVAFDLEVVRLIGKPNIEVVTNAFAQCWLSASENPFVKIKIADALIIDNIPSYQTPQGPYHDCLLEARENRYLKEFRAWVANKSSITSESEVNDVKNEVTRAIQKAQDEMFLRYLSGRSQAFSAAKIVFDAAADALIPLSSTVVALAEGLNNYFESRNNTWQGFIVSMRALKNRPPMDT